VAALTLDVFHKYTDRVVMANIAQMVNVLQAMILTDDKGGMVLTPTYHVFRMYKVHQDATYLPFDLICNKKKVEENRTVPMISATASRDKNGVIHLSLSNVDADNSQEITVELPGVKGKKVTGEILTAANLTDHNTFESPNMVKPAAFNGAKIVGDGVLTVNLPAKSIVTLEIK
jgi:alpha-N-arabinofuranosidase